MAMPAHGHALQAGASLREAAAGRAA